MVISEDRRERQKNDCQMFWRNKGVPKSSVLGSNIVVSESRRGWQENGCQMF